jgi:hypothetical protein
MVDRESGFRRVDEFGQDLEDFPIGGELGNRRGLSWPGSSLKFAIANTIACSIPQTRSIKFLILRELVRLAWAWSYGWLPWGLFNDSRGNCRSRLLSRR